MSQTAVIDIEKIEQLISDVGSENAPMLFEMFLGELQTYKQQLQHQVELTVLCREMCHSLKSSAASFGATALLESAVDIDTMVKQQQPFDENRTAAQFIKLIEITLAGFEEHFAGQ